MPVIVQPANVVLKNQLPAQPPLKGSLQEDPVYWDVTYPSRAKSNNVGGARRTGTTTSAIQPGFVVPFQYETHLPPNPADDVEFGQGEPVFRRPVYTPPMPAKPNGQV